MIAFQHLSADDLKSVTWQRVKRELADRLDELRRLNDAQLDATATAALRGRIEEVKRWLEGDQPPVQMQEVDRDVGY